MTALERRFFALCIAIPLLLILVLGSMAWSELQTERAQSEDQRVEQIARGLAARISYAVQVGVPIDRLAGLDIEFSETLKQHPEVGSVSLTDALGKPISPHQATSDNLPKVTQPVQVGGRTVGFLNLTLTKRSQTSWLESGLILLAVWILGACVIYETVRFEIRRGPMLRNAVIDRSTHRLSSGDFTVIYGGASAIEADPRPRQIAAAIRGVHERMLRLRRLVGSLRQTEPSRVRRERLDALLDEAQGKERFALNRTAVRLLNAAYTEARFILFLFSCSVTGLLWSGIGKLDTRWALASLAAFVLSVLGGRAFTVKFTLKYSRALIVAVGIGFTIFAFAFRLIDDSAAVEFLARVFAGIGLGWVLAATDSLAHDRAIATLAAPKELVRDSSFGFANGMLLVAPTLVPILSYSFGATLAIWMFGVPLIASLLTLIRLVGSSAPWSETALHSTHSDNDVTQSVLHATHRVILLSGGLSLGAVWSILYRFEAAGLESNWLSYAVVAAMMGLGWASGTHWRLGRTPFLLSAAAMILGVFGLTIPMSNLLVQTAALGLCAGLAGLGWGLMSGWLNGRTGRAIFGGESVLGVVLCLLCVYFKLAVWTVPMLVAICVCYVILRTRGRGVNHAS